MSFVYKNILCWKTRLKTSNLTCPGIESMENYVKKNLSFVCKNRIWRLVNCTWIIFRGLYTTQPSRLFDSINYNMIFRGLYVAQPSRLIDANNYNKFSLVFQYFMLFTFSRYYFRFYILNNSNNLTILTVLEWDRK